MNLPKPTDYIDIHNHGARFIDGQFSIENLMAHEERLPDNEPGIAYSIGIHPWFLNEENHEHLIDVVRKNKNHPNLIALGEAGFDRIKGPSITLEKTTFEEQIQIANEKSKPVFIHCVRAWDELLSEHKRLRPTMPWLIHGFRGKKELALQLISKGMYLSFWFDFILKPESTPLLKSLPKEKIFLETDGSGVDIKTLYEKTASDLDLSVDELKSIILTNFKEFFKL
jgi:TatD DNase family protein